MATTVLKHYKISPAPDSSPEFSLPIVFFDMIWYSLPGCKSVFFFDFPSCSKPHFLDTVIPELKHSLSLTLTHFLPFAGNIIHPLNPGKKPVTKYAAGDSISFTVSESEDDFNHLTGNTSRACDQFYAFAPNFPPVTKSPDSIAWPVMALQVTLFPGKGICISFMSHHALADAKTVESFAQAWALINRTKPDVINVENCLAEAKLLPFYDRTTVTDINGLDSIYWDQLIEYLSASSSVEPPPVKIPQETFRTTFVVKKEEIQKMKDLVLTKRPDVARLSSFTVICAFMWVCSAKSAALNGEQVSDDEPEHINFPADCRSRLDPPLPSNYFGNCVSLVRTETKHGELKGDEGFVKAAVIIGEAIRKWLDNEKGIVHGAEKWLEEFVKLIGKRQFGVSGSPRFDFYGVDYGWGRPVKVELLFIDGNGAISLSKSRQFEGGLEIGLARTKLKMDAFTKVFNDVLGNLLA